MLSQLYTSNPGVESHSAPNAGVAQTYPRFMSATSLSALASGQLFLVALEVPSPIAVADIGFVSGGTAMTFPNHWWFALYDSGLNLLSQTADQVMAGWAANTLKSLALGTPQTLLPGLYYLGIMVNAGVVPSLLGFADSTALSGSITGALTCPILHGTSSGSLTTTAPNPAGAITASVNYPYSFVS